MILSEIHPHFCWTPLFLTFGNFDFGKHFESLFFFDVMLRSRSGYIFPQIWNLNYYCSKFNSKEVLIVRVQYFTVPNENTHNANKYEYFVLNTKYTWNIICIYKIHHSCEWNSLRFFGLNVHHFPTVFSKNSFSHLKVYLLFFSRKYNHPDIINPQIWHKNLINSYFSQSDIFHVYRYNDITHINEEVSFLSNMCHNLQILFSSNFLRYLILIFLEKIT